MEGFFFLSLWSNSLVIKENKFFIIKAVYYIQYLGLLNASSTLVKNKNTKQVQKLSLIAVLPSVTVALFWKLHWKFQKLTFGPWKNWNLEKIQNKF